jgi:hypothetical protein
MILQDDLGSFIRENKDLASSYAETKLEIFRLKIIRMVSRLAGQFIWLLVSLFLLSLLFIFLGLVTGFWLSELMGSYTRGFGLTALIMLVVIILVAALRKILFIDPFIRTIIRKTSNDIDDQNGNHSNKK